MSLRYLSDADLQALGVTGVEMVNRLEHLIRAGSLGEAHSAPKSSLYPGDDRLFMSTISSADDPPYMVVKSLGMNAANASRGLASIGSLITVFDSDTGLPVGIMDGGWITAVRTAALSVVAAKALADPAATTIAFVGAGVQARSHLDLFAEHFPLKTMSVLGRSEQGRAQLIAHGQSLGIDVTNAVTAQEVVESADLVITTVPNGPGFEPFLNAGWLQSGAFASMVDLGRSWLPESMSQFGSVFVDDLAQEQGVAHPMVSLDLVRGDLADLVTAPENKDRNVGSRAFVFRGIALGDLAAAGICFERAVEIDAGVALS